MTQTRKEKADERHMLTEHSTHLQQTVQSLRIYSLPKLMDLSHLSITCNCCFSKFIILLLFSILAPLVPQLRATKVMVIGLSGVQFGL